MMWRTYMTSSSTVLETRRPVCRGWLMSPSCATPPLGRASTKSASAATACCSILMRSTCRRYRAWPLFYAAGSWSARGQSLYFCKNGLQGNPPLTHYRKPYAFIRSSRRGKNRSCVHLQKYPLFFDSQKQPMANLPSVVFSFFML